MPDNLLPIELLIIDAGTQSRLKISEDTVQDYVEVIERSEGIWQFPPLDVFTDGSDDNYMIADGFHRYHAARRRGVEQVPCVIHKGTASDARIFAMTANDRHGLRMTRADKHACIEWLLDNCEDLSAATIAAKAGVSRRTVTSFVAKRKTRQGSTAQLSQSSGGNGTASAPHQSTTEQPDSDPFDEAGEEADPFDEPQQEAEEDAPEEGDPVRMQRLKTVKTIQALQRAWDDLNELKENALTHAKAVQLCQWMLHKTEEWK